jgi:hypothetical protein
MSVSRLRYITRIGVEQMGDLANDPSPAAAGGVRLSIRHWTIVDRSVSTASRLRDIFEHAKITCHCGRGWGTLSTFVVFQAIILTLAYLKFTEEIQYPALAGRALPGSATPAEISEI